MEKPAPSDPELLADWLNQHRESAFHALVARYAGLVHATARRASSDDSIAAEAAQLTFITLAQKAKSLTFCASLGGWLHTTALMQAKNLIRKSQRENRKRQLLQAAMETEPPHASNDIWQEMQPVLDDALASLSDKDRDVLLLRFYRSLTIREIATTLGIATDAAQKRIDRATERLRDKLTRRGVQTSGTLSAAMLTGFAADAQAALPISVLASKAIAAGAIGSSSISALIILMTASKASVPFVLMLAGLIAWVGTQRVSIASLEKEISTLRTGITEFESTTATITSLRKISHTVKVFHTDQPIDWKEVEAYLADPKRDPQWLASLQKKLATMSPEDLIEELKRIAILYPANPSEQVVIQMERLIVAPLIAKNPELPLRHLIGRIDEPGYSRANMLCDAMREWTKIDQEKAIAWFDEQLAAGAFEENELNRNFLVDMFLTHIIGVLIIQDMETALLRLRMIPEIRRSEIIHRCSEDYLPKNITDYRAYAELVRSEVVARGQHYTIANFTVKIPFEKVADFLNTIEASPTERAMSAERVGKKLIYELSNGEKITRSNFDTMREWTGKVAPDAVGQITGILIARAITDFTPSLTYDETAQLALDYHAETKDDDILVGFLYFSRNSSNDATRRKVTSNIIDPKRRERAGVDVGIPFKYY